MARMACSLIEHIARLLIQPVAFSLINAITGKVEKVEFPLLLSLPLMIKVLGKGVTRVKRGYTMEKKSLASLYSLSNIKINKYFSYQPRINWVNSMRQFAHNRRCSLCDMSQ